MKKYDKKKKQAGFTLVEVIVVAVIVAAMAAVAVPMYLGYVQTSRKNSAANAAGSVASFCGACRNSAGTLNIAAVGNDHGAQVECTPLGGGTTSTIQIPDEINIAIDTATPGVVTGYHVQHATDTVSYNF
ncbi:MAG TPA: prepilin-type N-terminal cleavage/methylation domain-containing protein [Fibrobacteria bacterium]|nr:prepilin-type N-terminal cleavage/methylation domain-containing protein [Fibrobacteria bacterium]